MKEFAPFEHMTDVADEPNLRDSDGGCDPLGGFIIGDMDYEERTKSSVCLPRVDFESCLLVGRRHP